MQTLKVKYHKYLYTVLTNRDEKHLVMLSSSQEKDEEGKRIFKDLVITPYVFNLYFITNLLKRRLFRNHQKIKRKRSYRSLTFTKLPASLLHVSKVYRTLDRKKGRSVKKRTNFIYGYSNYYFV